MTAETKPVDVLRVFDDMASTVQLVSNEHKAWHARIIEARAAVAELIEAVVDAAMRRTSLHSTDYIDRMNRLYAAVYAANGDRPLTGDLASRAPANLAEALARTGGAQ